jgi:putative transposase
MDVLETAMAENGVPEIINSDQGSQYTSPSWTNYLERNGIKISMDGKGRATDNIWIERFWKTIKYNHIYLNPCDTEVLNYMKEFRPISSIITRKNTKALG